jgi:hypothetical protein
MLEFTIEHEAKGHGFWAGVEDFLEAVGAAAVETITPAEDARIAYRSRTTSREALLRLIRCYQSYPRYRNEETLDAIYEGYALGKPMDRPLVVEFGDGGRRVFSGNTRMDVAFQLGIEPEVLVLRASE